MFGGCNGTHPLSETSACNAAIAGFSAIVIPVIITLTLHQQGVLNPGVSIGAKPDMTTVMTP
jgi:hypothetical protein